MYIGDFAMFVMLVFKKVIFRLMLSYIGDGVDQENWQFMAVSQKKSAQ